MKHHLFTWLLFCAAAIAADSASLNGNARIVFIGDSITGQGGGWLGAGYVFKIREALAATYPDSKPDLIPLGGSGMGVGAWLNLAKNEDKQKHDLDVKGVEVAAALSKPADVMIVMLGMNDVLAPYVNETVESLDQWIANYCKLVTTLSARLKPKVIGLATITPQTEDPGTPKNRVMARMNERITKLAAELKARLLPTNALYWDTLNQARRTQPDFSLAGDRIHPGPTGHVVIARAMLRGLGEEKAAEWLKTERLDKTLANLKPGTAPTMSPPWLVTSGLILRGWQEKPADADLSPNPIDLAIERGEDFTQAPAKAGGAPLAWQPFQSTINLTDGANPGSVDFAGICFGQNFEAGYGARWIRSDKSRKLKLDLKTSGVGSVIHLTVWLNGQRLYSNLITQEPKRQTSCEVELRPGWNVLVLKSCHRTWQWQQTLNLTELDGSEAEGLEYRATFR
jgi:lysophospholipase L1-like esterase